MKTAGKDANLFFSIFDLIYQTMFLVDPAGPTTGQFVLQLLGLSGAFKRCALNFTN